MIGIGAMFIGIWIMLLYIFITLYRMNVKVNAIYEAKIRQQELQRYIIKRVGELHPIIESAKSRLKQ